MVNDRTIRPEYGQPGSQTEALEPLDIVIVNYNGLATVLDTIASVMALEGITPHVIVVDDGSTDGSVEAIMRAFSGVEIHREPGNTRQVNRLRNVGLSRARTARVLMSDNDVIFDPRCAAEMLRVMRSDALIAACMPRLMYLNDPATVYIGGGAMHYVGAAVQPYRDRPYDGRTQPEPAVGGGIMLLDRQKVAAIGGFDEGYVLAWGDDIELHQRLLLTGSKCYYVPRAVCLHEHKLFGVGRHYRAQGQVRNRWRYLLTHYSARTLLLTAPALLLFDAVQAAFLTVRGLPHLYLLGVMQAFRDLPATFRKRREVQRLRVVGDRDILFAGSIYVRPEHGTRGRFIRYVIDAMSRAFAAYWRLLQPAPRHAGASPGTRSMG